MEPETEIETMANETKNTAQQISARFADDGQRWSDATGQHIEDICENACMTTVTDGGASTATYEFRDGSSIVIMGGGWDIGGAS
jgi:hypothetical protein